MAETNGQLTTFVGVVENKVFFIDSQLSNRERFLIRAVNNRTRERNYFRRYAEMLDGDISADEFDRDIEEHEDEYVPSQDHDASAEDIHTMLALAPHIKDTKDMEDLAILFSVKPQSFEKCLEKQTE